MNKPKAAANKSNGAKTARADTSEFASPTVVDDVMTMLTSTAMYANQ